MNRTLLLMGIGALLVATAADAHHSFARDYDEQKQISLEGDVVSFEYKNPHSWVYFTAKDSTGVVRQFGAEWGNPNRLSQSGVTGTSISVGDHVIIAGAPNHSATEYSVHLKSIRRPADGWVWPANGQAAGNNFRGGNNFRRRR